MYIYMATVVAAYDADTITVDVDLGFHQISQGIKLRLFGIDAPEMRGVERPQGTVARDWLRDQILDKQIVLRTYKDGRGKGKYGRWLADIFPASELIRDERGGLSLREGAISYNQQLVNKGLAELASY